MNASLRYGLTTAATALVVLALAAFLDLIAFKNPVRKDLTENQRHSLSEQTISVLQDLEQPVKLTVFISGGDQAKLLILDLLEVYRYHSDRFTYETVDPELKPGTARDYNLEQYGVPVAFFETEEGKRESVTGIRNLHSLEEQLTNALVKVTRGRSKRIYVLTGHGEASLEGEQGRTLKKARAALEDKSYVVEPLPLAGETRVPGDCDVLLVAGPAKALLPTEEAAVRRYLERGGRALFALDPQRSPSLAAVARSFGIQVGEDVVIDFNPLNQLFGGDPLVPIANWYEPAHPTMRNFNTASYFPEARSVEAASSPTIQATVLVKTSENSFTETTFEELRTGKVTLNGADRRGPVGLAAVAEWEPEDLKATEVEPPTEHSLEAELEAAATAEAQEEEEPESPQGGRLAVFGDSDFFTDQHFEAMGNSDLFLNVMNWLGQEEDLIAIRPKSAETQYVTLTAGKARLVFFLPVVVLPGLVLAAGGAVWWRRRQTG